MEQQLPYCAGRRAAEATFGDVHGASAVVGRSRQLGVVAATPREDAQPLRAAREDARPLKKASELTGAGRMTTAERLVARLEGFATTDGAR